MMKWQNYLQTLGLTDAESKVYLFCLKAGPKSVLEIAQSVSLSRVTIYNVIESLTKLGLMTSVEKGKKQYYASEPPERVVALAENKITSMQSTVHEIKNNIDELKLMQSGDKPVVKLYEGPEAFKAIQDDVLAQKIEVMYEFGNKDEIEKVYPNRENLKYFKKLNEKDIKRKLIYQSASADFPPGFTKRNNLQLVCCNNLKFKGDIFFYNDTIWLSSFKGKQITVMIKDAAIKETLQEAFDMLWESLPKKEK